MAAIKKYNGSTFIDAAIRKYSTASEIIVPPTTIYTDGTAITSYTIKGNTVQNGTPTPSAPITVQGVGELETTGEHSGEYKIPILNGQQTTNIYLSEQLMKIDTYSDSVVSSGTTTYQIRKVIFNGTETWNKLSGQHAFYTDLVDLAIDLGARYVICTHYIANTSSEDGTLRFANNKHELLVYDDYASAADFQTFLQQQYAAGTPVTVWYVLATPTTEQITAPSIPTTEGANTITVDTTVQPSEFTATWTGWHNASVKEYDGSEWQ